MNRPAKASLLLQGMGLVLLAGMCVDQMLLRSHAKKGMANEYHQAVQRAAAAMPLQFGDWVGKDTPVPVEATDVLKPNALISRRYTNIRKGWEVAVMVVHCRDAFDMSSHYPPICYPGGGWKLRSAKEEDWQIDDFTVKAMGYRFERDSLERGASIQVANSMMLPRVGSGRDMSSVDRIVGDMSRRFYGAGQIQIIVDASMSPADREEVVKAMLRAHRPVLNAILAGRD